MFHVLGGQAPRGIEILSLECRNGPSTERGIYVHEVSVIYVIKPAKSPTESSTSFVIFLIHEVSLL
jgi:hypothetical protein